MFSVRVLNSIWTQSGNSSLRTTLLFGSGCKNQSCGGRISYGDFWETVLFLEKRENHGYRYKSDCGTERLKLCCPRYEIRSLLQAQGLWRFEGKNYLSRRY